jgi:hypothetical protein
VWVNGESTDSSSDSIILVFWKYALPILDGGGREGADKVATNDTHVVIFTEKIKVLPSSGTSRFLSGKVNPVGPTVSG